MNWHSRVKTSTPNGQMWDNPRFDCIFAQYFHWVIFYDLHRTGDPAQNSHLFGNTFQKFKQFDAVKTMRDIRDKISSETQDMTFDELKVYIKQKLTDNKTKLVGL